VLMRSTISLSKAERVELSHRATSHAGRADDARRARLILSTRDLLDKSPMCHMTEDAASEIRRLIAMKPRKPEIHIWPAHYTADGSKQFAMRLAYRLSWIRQICLQNG